jgi:uncharacterized protein
VARVLAWNCQAHLREKIMRILTVVALSAGLLAPLAAPSFGQQINQPTISVTGEGVIEVAPDIATLMIGVTTQGDTAAAALTANSAAMDAVLARLTAAGIEARDMQTWNLSLGPDYSKYDGSSGAAPTTYIASNMLTVRVRALASLGSVLDAAVADGANTLNGLTFGLADPGPALNEARKEAVADARARAEFLAEAAGVKIGRPISISESVGSGPLEPMFRDKEAADSVPVASGELGITANVTVFYEIVE